jgi:hypothetical protein
MDRIEDIQLMLPFDLEGRRQLLQIERDKLVRQIKSSDTTNESTQQALERLGELTYQYNEIFEEMKKLGIEVPWLG